AEGDRERMLGGRAIGLEARQMPVEDLPPPDQRVVAVVVGVGDPDEESDDRHDRKAAERPWGDRVFRQGADSVVESYVPRRGAVDSCAFHVGVVRRAQVMPQGLARRSSEPSWPCAIMG